MNRLAAQRMPREETAGCRTAAMHKAQPIAEGPEGQCVGTGRKYRSWMRMDDAELLSVVNRAVLENGITGRKMLREFDSGMASRLSVRGLWNRVEYCKKDGARKECRPDAAAPEEAGPEAKAPAVAGESSESPALGVDEIVFLAQSAINDGGLSSMEELSIIDPELHGAVVEAGAEARLAFPIMVELPSVADDDGEISGVKTACPAGNGQHDAAGPGERNGDRGPGSGNGLGDGKNGDGRAHAMDEESMYRRICSECFRIGGANAFIGGSRTTIPKLQSAMHRKLGGPEHKLFRKCWDRMAAEGAIAFNSNSTAASLNPYADVRDGKLRSALLWAAAEQRRA